MTCIVTVDRVDIDVEKLYRDHGYATLPPQLTITGAHLREHGKVDPSYRVYKAPDIQRGIKDVQAVPVQHGDRFYALPPATY
jgi:hypothetical protein